MVKEEMGNFSGEVDCRQYDYPEDFTVAWAESLPWPLDYSVITSQPPSYLTSYQSL